MHYKRILSTGLREGKVTSFRFISTNFIKSIEYCCISVNSLGKKTTIHQVTTMLATCTNVLFPGPNHLQTTSTDDPSLAGARAIIKVKGHQYQWLAGG